jgi:uncharacterized protein (TIGR02145 family)
MSAGGKWENTERQTEKRYFVEHRLGNGGMAEVYRTKDTGLDVHVAMKVLKDEYTYQPFVRERFIKEGRLLFRLNHPSVVRVFDLIEETDFVAIVMELIEGETIEQYLKAGKRFSNDEIKRYFNKLLEAVQYVHTENLIHRDIKPSNVMLVNGNIKLLDFGIARDLQPDAALDETGTNIRMGTPIYMSPEQVRGDRGITSASDIYSLGVTLWHMVTGESLYNRQVLSRPDIEVAILRDALPLTNTHWDDIIQKATRKVPTKRFSSAHEFLAAMPAPDRQKPTFVNSNNWRKESILGVPEEEATIVSGIQGKKDAFPSVQIGTQVWMTENLNTNTFRNGDIIPEAKSAESWRRAGERGEPAWCYYSNDHELGNKHGKLYNWYAVNDPRGLAPEGWRVSSIDDWHQLVTFLGGEDIVGNKLKNPNVWIEQVGDGCIGFDGFPAGYRDESGIFYESGTSCRWWLTNESDLYTAYYRGLYRKQEALYLFTGDKDAGFSVRCLKENFN